MEWLSETTELLATVCENVIILWFLTAFFGSRYDGYKKIIAFIAAVVITTVFTSLFSILTLFIWLFAMKNLGWL